jgi:hypothetical protein
VTQTTRVVAVQDWVNSQDVVTIWVIQMSFEGDVVKLRQIIGKLLCLLALLDNILLFKPMPWPIDLSEVFNDK